MAGLIGSVINGIGNLVSGGTWQQSGQELKQQEYNSAEAEKQRQWQEQMSNTAYQRGTEDMQSAGVNPAMAYANGASGASTPSGAAAHSSAQPSNGDSVSSLINSVANIARTFNSDKDKNNNVDINTAVKAVTTIAKILG